MSENERAGFDTNADLQEHLAELEADAQAADASLSSVTEITPAQARMQRLQDDITQLREEIDGLRVRLTLIRQQTGTVVRSNLQWADDSAHDQLGAYPWAKLAGAMAVTFVAARVLRHLPMGAIASAALPLVMTRFDDDRYRQ
ncbi:MAG: hypothetical protein KGI75_03710 [Rhizobiaceae bacterium]|nr:hypothetical protein [Rhizobiaceae bacterium]